MRFISNVACTRAPDDIMLATISPHTFSEYNLEVFVKLFAVICSSWTRHCTCLSQSHHISQSHTKNPAHVMHISNIMFRMYSYFCAKHAQHLRVKGKNAQKVVTFYAMSCIFQLTSSRHSQTPNSCAFFARKFAFDKMCIKCELK